MKSVRGEFKWPFKDRVSGIIKKIDPQKDSKSNDIPSKTWKKK